MLVRLQTNIGGGVQLKPTALKAGYVAKSGTITQQIDLNKTYILSICTNANSEADFMDTFLIDKGQKSFIHDSSGITQDITITGNTLSFTNTSSTYARSYCLTQLGYYNGEYETIENVDVVNGRITITPTSTYTFVNDYKLVEINTYGNNNGQIYRLNGIGPFKTAQGTGSQYSASYPTSMAMFKDVKTGDVLSVASGSLISTIIGYY